MDALVDLFEERNFQVAATYGGIAFVVITLAAAVRIGGRRPPLGGIGIAVACLGTLAGWGPADKVKDLPPELLLGVGGLALAGVFVQVFTLPLWSLPLVYAPGSVLVGLALDDPQPGWVRPLVVGGSIAAAALGTDVDRYQERRGFGPVLFAIAAGGLYATVPDTERALVLLGAAVPMLLLGAPTPVASLGPPGVGAVSGLFLWVAATDGAGRPPSIIGAFGALGLLLCEPFGRRLLKGLRPKMQGRFDQKRHLVLLADIGLFSIGVALYSSRVAGFAEHGYHSVLLLVPAAAACVVVGGAIPAPPRPRVRRRRHPEMILDRR